MTVRQVSYHETVNVLQGMSGLPEPAGPFDRADWFDLLVADGVMPTVAIAHGVRPAALVLANCRATGGLRSLTNWYSFAWRPLGAEPQALSDLASALRGLAHRIVMQPVPDEDGSASALELAFRAAGWWVRREPCDHNHVLELAGRDFATYWSERPGPMRTTLKRKGKRVDTCIHTMFDAAAWDAYEAIYAASWKPAEGAPEMLRAFAEIEGQAGRLRLGLASFEDKPVAAQFWTVENGTAYIHKLAHLEEHKALSAGTTLSAAMFAHAIDNDGVGMIDFGTGDDAYKRDWMEIDRPRYRLECLDPSSPRAWGALARGAAGNLLSRLRGVRGSAR